MELKADSLSQAGRVVLIHSNLPRFVYFWNKDPNAVLANLIVWDFICQSKCLGGLGFRNAKITNMIFLMNLLWMIMSSPGNI